MAIPTERFFRINNRLIYLLLAVVLINTALIALGYYILLQRLGGSDPMLVYKQEVARDLADYNHRLATELYVIEEQAVREALAEYNYALDLVTDSEELVQVILNQGRMVQEVIRNQADAKVREEVLAIVNADHRVQDTRGKSHLFIRIIDGQVTVSPDQFIETTTLHRINNILGPHRIHGNQSIDIEISDGYGQLVLTQLPEDQLQTLNDDLNQLRLQFHELRVKGGLAEMVGPGITISVFDAEEQQGSVSLVHDADVRDLVNELFSAGAIGVSVGGQRLITTSSIRCSGPLIMVNFRQIATNPVLIEAVGEPDLLVSGLNIIIADMENRRGLGFEITNSGFIMLPAYHDTE